MHTELVHPVQCCSLAGCIGDLGLTNLASLELERWKEFILIAKTADVGVSWLMAGNLKR